MVRRLLAWARWARLSWRTEASKDVEILVLRHQSAVAQRRLPPRELQRLLTWSEPSVAHLARRRAACGRLVAAAVDRDAGNRVALASRPAAPPRGRAGAAGHPGWRVRRARRPAARFSVQ